MRRIIAVLIVLLPFFGGCILEGWQPTKASQTVDINMGNFGTGQQVITPSDQRYN